MSKSETESVSNERRIIYDQITKPDIDVAIDVLNDLRLNATITSIQDAYAAVVFDVDAQRDDYPESSGDENVQSDEVHSVSEPFLNVLLPGMESVLSGSQWRIKSPTEKDIKEKKFDDYAFQVPVFTGKGKPKNIQVQHTYNLFWKSTNIYLGITQHEGQRRITAGIGEPKSHLFGKKHQPRQRWVLPCTVENGELTSYVILDYNYSNYNAILLKLKVPEQGNVSNVEAFPTRDMDLCYKT